MEDSLERHLVAAYDGGAHAADGFYLLAYQPAEMQPYLEGLLSYVQGLYAPHGDIYPPTFVHAVLQATLDGFFGRMKSIRERSMDGEQVSIN
ncbi:hypothetical protein [Xanthobacter sediminis]